MQRSLERKQFHQSSERLDLLVHKTVLQTELVPETLDSVELDWPVVLEIVAGSNQLLDSERQTYGSTCLQYDRSDHTAGIVAFRRLLEALNLFLTLDQFQHK